TYETNTSQIAFFNRLVDRARNIPGVTDVGAVSIAPTSGGNMVVGFALPNEPRGPKDPAQHAEELDAVEPDYFRTVSIPLRSGRVFTRQDDDRAPWVMIVSESFAKKLWPGQNPIGKRAYVGAGSGFPMDTAAREVVGVVGDVRRSALDQAPKPQMYLPEGQLAFDRMSLMVRTRPGATNVPAELRQLVMSMDPDQAMSPVRSFESVLALSLARQKFSASASTLSKERTGLMAWSGSMLITSWRSSAGTFVAPGRVRTMSDMRSKASCPSGRYICGFGAWSSALRRTSPTTPTTSRAAVSR